MSLQRQQGFEVSGKIRKSERPIAETTKIIHFIMNILYTNGNVPVKLMSTRMFAEKFNVARSTVSLALDKLKQEGSIVSKQGVGFFTNPDKLNRHYDSKPLIGMLHSSGKYFFYRDEVVFHLSTVAMALAAAGFNIRPIQLQGMGEEAVLDELNNSYLNGLYWSGETEEMKRVAPKLKKMGVAVVTSKVKIPGINNVTFDQATGDLKKAGRKIAEMMKRMIYKKDQRVEHIRI